MPDLTCPKCSGRGTTAGFVDFRDRPGAFGQWRCENCRGTGAISETQARWIERGKALRQQRQQQRVSLRQRAEQLGVSMTELSAAEQGRVDPTRFEEVDQ